MATKQKPARSTAIAWRRALKAVGVDVGLMHVMTVYLRSKTSRFKEPLHKLAFPPESQTQLVVEHAQEFADLVAAAGFSAYVILRGGNAEVGLPPYIEITNGYKPHLYRNDTLLATTED